MDGLDICLITSHYKKTYQAYEQEWFHFSRMAQIHEHVPITDFEAHHATVHRMV